MALTKDYYKNILNTNTFNTTYKTDYRDVKVAPHVKTVYKEKLLKQRPCVPPQKHFESLGEVRWQVPFRLGFHKKGIVDTDPRVAQESFTMPEDTGKVQARKIRPRVVMSPAFCLDEINNEHIREVIIEDTYTSDMMKANQDMAKQFLSQPQIRAPFPGQYAPANPVTFSMPEKYISKEWRRQTVKWDKHQLRAGMDWDKMFWQQHYQNYPR